MGNGSGYGKNKRVVVLDLSGMVAGSKYRGEFEERIKNVVKEVSQNKGILLLLTKSIPLSGQEEQKARWMLLIS